MLAIHRSAFARGAVLPLTFLAFLSGCSTWSTVDTSPRAFFSEEQPDEVRVTLPGAHYQIESPAIEADSIVGIRGGRRSDGSRIAIPLAEVERLEERTTDGPALAAGILLGVLTVGFVAVVVGAQTIDPD